MARALRRAALLAVAVLGACVAPAHEAVEPDPVLEVIQASHPRELRAIWVATVANIDFPSRQGLDTQAQRAELRALVERVDEAGLNAILFQVRPEGDAVYRSELEPWSRYLSGTQGVDPGWDPLEELIQLAHGRNIEVHAWMNPYRAGLDRRRGSVAPHVSVLHPDWVVPYGTHLWMDPGRPEVRAHTVAVVEDVVRRYDVDGLHFDDYFYPYPNGRPFPDDATWQAYVAGGGSLERDAWRRSNVDALVRDVSVAVRSTRPGVLFGISPFGIYRPGYPEGIRGLDQVAALHADPVAWMDAGWVDYVAPQLYWPTTQTAQAYGPLMGWWADRAQGRTTVFVGNYLSQVGQTPAWTPDELRTQHALAHAHPGVQGNIWFSARPLLEDRHGVLGMMQELYARPALPPVRYAAPPGLPDVEIDGGELCLQHSDEASVRSYVVYDETGSVRAVVAPGEHTHVDMPPGRYAVTAAGRGGAESGGVPVVVLP